MYKKDMSPSRRGPLQRNPVGKMPKKVNEKPKGTFPPLPFVTEISNNALLEHSERNGLETRVPTRSGF